jgi:hypothetical protein
MLSAKLGQRESDMSKTKRKSEIHMKKIDAYYRN